MSVESTLRQQLCNLINAPSPDDIGLLKNTSEALSVVAFGLEWAAGDNIVSTDQEFPSNRIVWEALRDRGVKLRQANLKNGNTPEDALFSQVDKSTRLIAVSSLQYGSGFLLNLEKSGSFVRRIISCFA